MMEPGGSAEQAAFGVPSAHRPVPVEPVDPAPVRVGAVAVDDPSVSAASPTGRPRRAGRLGWRALWWLLVPSAIVVVPSALWSLLVVSIAQEAGIRILDEPVPFEVGLVGVVLGLPIVVAVAAVSTVSLALLVRPGIRGRVALISLVTLLVVVPVLTTVYGIVEALVERATAG